MPMPLDSPGFVFQVALHHVRPTGSRTLELPSSMTFLEFHQTLQLATGWEDTHLFDFTHRKITVVSPDYGVPLSATTWMTDHHAVAEWDLQPEDIYVYRYHEIRIGRMTDEPLSRPRVMSGEDACHPGDVGGPPGYNTFFQIMADPKRPEHQDYKAWSRARVVPDLDVTNPHRRLTKKVG